MSDYTLAQAVVKHFYENVKLRRTLPLGPCLKMVGSQKAMFSWVGVWYDRFAKDEADREGIKNAFEEGRALSFLAAMGEEDVDDEEDPAKCLRL